MANANNLETNNFKIPNVFGSNATYKTAPASIPNTSPAGSVKASWRDGFPEQTFLPNNAPSGADFNGLFGLISALLMNTQMGQLINNYDAAFQTSIGGYPNGAIIWFAPNGDWSNKMLFQSVIDNNTNVPYNTTSDAIGAGWKQLFPVTHPAPYYSTPQITLISTNTPRPSGNISLSQTIDNFDAIMVIYSGDDYAGASPYVFNVWAARFCYTNYADKVFTIVGGGDVYWNIKVSSLFTNTWRVSSENCVIQGVYGLKW